nr:MAG TPA: hypothetical protein [Caudoviricetes sp.]
MTEYSDCFSTVKFCSIIIAKFFNCKISTL